MQKKRSISGFSKLSKQGKLQWVAETFFEQPEETAHELERFWHRDEEQQQILDGFSENTVSNYYLPYGVAPNFLINDKLYTVPMVIEESSVVAAASSAAKFWMERGGFRSEVIQTTKVGQVHFSWSGNTKRLQTAFPHLRKRLLADARPITANMESRGGGVLDIKLLDLTDQEPDYFQLRVSFETCDSMGANFINSVLESFGESLTAYLREAPGFTDEEREVEIIMAILSNYTPECLVRCTVECPVEELENCARELNATAFARKFRKAVRIAHIDPYRATTHNKGIFNGVDAVVLATANDFRAVEACGHTYAARDGQYRSLSSCEVQDGMFRFWLDLPIALGTVGGLTRIHPLAKKSLEMLGNPSARELMEIIAAVGLAQNFAAVRSLVTTGIQHGHMKMHLHNILVHFSATQEESHRAFDHFQDKLVSFSAVRSFLEELRAGPKAAAAGKKRDS